MLQKSSPKQVLWRSFFIFVVVAMLMGVGIGSTDPVTATTPEDVTDPIPVDPNVYVALEKKGTTDVLVILKEQADLSKATGIQSKNMKGAYVYQQLTSVVERTQGGIQAFLDFKGADYHSYWIQNMLRVTVDAQLVDEITRQPGIKYIEYYHEPYPDVIGHDLGPAFGQEYGPIYPANTVSNQVKELAGWKEYSVITPEAIEWNISRVNADDAWALGITGSGVVVGDLDTGVQWDHPALINQYRGWNGAIADHNYNWFDGLTGSATPVDYDGHGTHTMGTIVGDDGDSNQIGVAPGAEWIACAGVGSPYVDPFGCFEFFMAPTELDGTDPRPDLAPHVISNSWSSATDYHGAIQALYAAGIFFSKSAGNNGPACSTITNPGQWSEVTAAAAFSSNDTIASFSSRGPVTLGYDVVMKPDISAPGVKIRSSYPGNLYATMSGTSMACPHVTGAVALLISANPELAGQIEILQMLLKQAAEPMIDSQCLPYVDHPNDVWGWGILDAAEAVQEALDLDLGTIAGTVYNTVTEDPIPNVNLSYMNTDTVWSFNDMSGPDGSYEATLVAGTYDLTAESYGYLPANISSVVIEDGELTEQDIYLDVAPVWTVSGVITETQTGDPLAATIEFVDSPVSVDSNPLTGEYSTEIAQGTYWVKVSSVGHSSQVVEVVIDSDLTLNFSLDAIYNYYMRAEECQPVFKWYDITSYVLNRLDFGSNWDDNYVGLTLPGTRSFYFYGEQYSRLYVGTNGIVTFSAGEEKWSGPIPDPATPNNGVYAFSDDLFPNPDPAVSSGKVYWAYLEDRYLVIEYYQVEHYPSGNPETFEIILDLDTNRIIIQYLEVSDSSNAVSGVENGTGTEATQYAYADPALIADNMAVSFYPAFGTPPIDVGWSSFSGTVVNLNGGLPVDDATVIAVGEETEDFITFYTDATGVYEGGLCTDNYTLWAEKLGYEQSAEVSLAVEKDNSYVVDFALKPIIGFIYTPRELYATIDGQDTFETYLYFGNTGGGDITYDVEENPEVSWLTISPIHGIVMPDEDEVLSVIFDSNLLTPGVFETTIKVETSDPVYSEVNIPVELTVTCNPVYDLDFSYLPTAPGVGEEIEFTATASGGVPITYDWDFGDGASDLGEVVLHPYDVSGFYTVTLTANNCAAIPAIASKVVEVGGYCEPVHDVEVLWTPIEPTVGEVVTFEASGMGDLPITFDWTFSDGFTATGEVVEHNFSHAGTYTITVTAENCGGETITVDYEINVLPSLIPTTNSYLPLAFKY